MNKCRASAKGQRERGRESFSGKPLAMWLIVARKRLPTPLRTVQADPTLIVLPVLIVAL
jgi:hypothetical protein